MDRNKIKERLELALRLEKPPTLEEVLEEVSTRGVLRGPVDWVFPAWIIYVEYATQRIIKTFQLTEEERRTLLNFRDALKRLLLEAQRQAKEKLTSIYKAIADGTYKVEGEETVCAGRYVDVCKRELGSTYYNPRHKRLGAFSRHIEASAREA
jgi:hypothetical protein